MNKKIIISLLGLGLIFMPNIVMAATSYSIENIGSSIGLGTSDLKHTVVNIIQWVLGILALVCVVMIIIGGVMLMTPTSEEKAEKAKKIITGAVIGLIVVLLAWAVVIFVAGTTANLTE
jgi:TRAP-type C4-dicarboxylate transport system permease small subunit